MSQENVEIVRRMYAAFYGGDTEGALAYFHPDVIVDARGWTLGIGHGREELTRILTTWAGTFDEWREEVVEMRDLDSQVYVVAIERGRGKGSGVEVENRYALLYEIEGDKITHMTPTRSLGRPSKPPGCTTIGSPDGGRRYKLRSGSSRGLVRKCWLPTRHPSEGGDHPIASSSDPLALRRIAKPLPNHLGGSVVYSPRKDVAYVGA
jgi:ketosteroid isomerase-like protein